MQPVDLVLAGHWKCSFLDPKALPTNYTVHDMGGSFSTLHPHILQSTHSGLSFKNGQI